MTSTAQPSDHPTDHLSADDAAQVRALIEEAFRTDGVEAVSEQFLLRLGDEPGAERVWHVVHRTGGIIDGYAVAERTDSPGAELVVAPQSRRRGIGTELLQKLRTATGVPLNLWAHGDLPEAHAFGVAVAGERVRSLLELRRPAGEVEVPPAPEGVTIRTFVPGQDDAAWLEVNAAAFASHAEQGAMTQRDLDERMAEPWFDPQGFFIAERDGKMIGFHWTKVHGPELGEVYVVGVHPDAQGLKLGKVLTALGLAHLAKVGVPEISLFVDGHNTAALALYRGLGFEQHRADSQWLTT